MVLLALSAFAAKPVITGVTRVDADLAGMAVGLDEQRAEGPDELALTSDGVAVLCARTHVIVVPPTGSPRRMPVPCDALGADGPMVLVLERNPANGLHPVLSRWAIATGGGRDTELDAVPLPDAVPPGTVLVGESGVIELATLDGGRFRVAESVDGHLHASTGAIPRDLAAPASIDGAEAVRPIAGAAGWHEVQDVELGADGIRVETTLYGPAGQFSLPDPIDSVPFAARGAAEPYSPGTPIAGDGARFAWLVPLDRCDDERPCAAVIWMNLE